MTTGDSFDLFPEENSEKNIEGPAGSSQRPKGPLADRMRPRILSELAGQEHLIGPAGPLGGLLKAGNLPSCILWGPPGVGKTTLARILAQEVSAAFFALSGVEAGVREMREVISSAKKLQKQGKQAVLFLDEIHRLNRAQQDAVLPHVEKGTITLIGATTDNPSFEVINPLLSRCRVFSLKRLEPKEISNLLKKAVLDTKNGLGDMQLKIQPGVLERLAKRADGDARRALGLLEATSKLAGQEGTLSSEQAERALGTQVWLYDRSQEEHYNVISAFIKSLRASDPDAALYYLARMLKSGEDPLFIARRLVIFASEDIGNADTHALPLATSTFLALERIGLPEGRIVLSQAVTYLACAEKSNASYKALEKALESVERLGSLSVPLHLRNAPTKLMKEEGYSEGYRYPHDEESAFVEDPNLPQELEGIKFYDPTSYGDESSISSRLSRLRNKRSKTLRKRDRES